MTIDSFKGPNAFLSNFYPSPIMVLGKSYATVEHYFQACKMRTDEYHEYVRLATSAARAKRVANCCKSQQRDGWDLMKEDVMYFALRLKFQPGSKLGKQLIATGDKPLVEGNTWSDEYWGVCNGIGLNRLGVLLMKVRQELLLDLVNVDLPAGYIESLTAFEPRTRQKYLYGEWNTEREEKK